MFGVFELIISQFFNLRSFSQLYTYKLTNDPRRAGISRRLQIGGDNDNDKKSCVTPALNAKALSVDADVMGIEARCWSCGTGGG